MTIKKKKGNEGTKDSSEEYIKKAEKCLGKGHSVKDVMFMGVGYALLAIAVELRDSRKEITKGRKKKEQRREASQRFPVFLQKTKPGVLHTGLKNQWHNVPS